MGRARPADRAGFAAYTYGRRSRGGGSGSGPWVQVGLVVKTVIPLSGVQSGVNDVVAPDGVAIGGSTNTASGGGSSVVGGYDNTASGASSGCYSCYLCTASGTVSACVGSDQATASGICATCVGSAGGEASGDWSGVFGGTDGVASGLNAAVLGGQGGLAAGDNAVSIGGGQAPGPGDVAIGTASSNFGVFGAACVPQQAGGGSGTAGPAYTANEQQMLQAVYTALNNLGFIA
jgi:hypothetical protein